METKADWIKKLTAAGVVLFPDTGDKDGKEFLAGYTRALYGNATSMKEMEAKRNRIVKDLRSDGWRTWTEPGSYMGGSPYTSYSFSAARGI